MKNTLRILAATALIGMAQLASAAHITIDDTDVDDVTISWADFEGGFDVNGTAYGAGGSVTVTDLSAPLTFTGFWIDLDANADSFAFDLGANPGAPTDITSQLGFDIFDNDPSSYAKIDGAFFAYNAFVYGSGPASYFQGDTLGYGASYLTFSYLSEAGEPPLGTPAPPMLALFGLALLGFGIRRQRQH